MTSESETETAAPENLVDLLNELVLPPDPAPVSLVPQTWGWAVVAVLLCVGLGAAFIALRQKRRANAYRRAALAALPDLAKDPAALARILRKTALLAFPRKDVASLHGTEWLAFLDATCAGASFQSGPGGFVATAPYRRPEQITPDDVDAVRHWIAHHQVEAAT